MPPPDEESPPSEPVVVTGMTFLLLHEGMDCNCLAFGGVENTTDKFSRRITKDTLGKGDFQSPYEQKRRMNITNDKQQCKYRGISIHKVGDNEAHIRNKYHELFAFSPKGAGFYCEFTFKHEAGKVWDTRTDSNPDHYTFLKCDAFTIRRVKVIKVVSILDNVGN